MHLLRHDAADPHGKQGVADAATTRFIREKMSPVVIVAQVAKMARTIWAVTAAQQDYQRGFQRLRPQAA